MSIKTDIKTPYQTLNYMKYVEIENDSRYPAVTGGAGQGVFNKSAILVQDINNATGTGESAGNFNFNQDSFGRTRVSAPFTLFDSSHRYRDNGKFAETITGSASSVFVPNEGLIDMEVGPLSGDKIYRESFQVFSYQPGKSLQTLNTFVMNPAKAGLQQRVGYFGEDNGIFFELSGSDFNIVERSLSLGADTRVSQADFNVDKFDGNGPSGVTLDLSKAQIQFIDIEWLGLGTVRTGFVINGLFLPAHYFHHANIITSTYLTTGSLPIRYEIENYADTGSNSKLKQVCSTVLSEGGYELRGFQTAVGTPVGSPRTTLAGASALPIISVRLKQENLDAIVVATAASVVGVDNNVTYQYQLIQGGTVTGGAWLSGSADSAVEYNLTATSVTNSQNILASGYFTSTTQSSPGLQLLREALFKFQLERNSFTGEAYPLTLAIAADTGSQDVLASLDWEEVSR